MSDRIDSIEEEDELVGILSVSVFAASLSVSANEFNCWRGAVVRRLLLVGGINAFVCEMSKSAATAVLLNIMVVMSLQCIVIRSLCLRSLNTSCLSFVRYCFVRRLDLLSACYFDSGRDLLVYVVVCFMLCRRKRKWSYLCCGRCRRRE